MSTHVAARTVPGVHKEHAMTRRPRVGILSTFGKKTVAAEVLDAHGNVIGYSIQLDSHIVCWGTNHDFTPLTEVPESRMDEPQETWATVVAHALGGRGPRVFVHSPDGSWVLLGLADARWTGVRSPWSYLIDPRPTTPTERATGVVGGEDQ